MANNSHYDTYVKPQQDAQLAAERERQAHELMRQQNAEADARRRAEEEARQRQGR